MSSRACNQSLREGRSRLNILKIFQNNHSKQSFSWSYILSTNLTEKWKIAEYFGENLDILTDLIWIFNKSNWFQNIFSKYLGGITLLSYSAGVLISKMLFRVVGFYSKFPLICVLLIKKIGGLFKYVNPKKLIFHFTRYSLRSGPSCLEKMIGTDIWAL